MPQTATLATPGTASRRGRMTQRTSSDSSICDNVAEVMPIFMARLSEDKDGRITGG